MRTRAKTEYHEALFLSRAFFRFFEKKAKKKPFRRARRRAQSCRPTAQAWRRGRHKSERKERRKEHDSAGSTESRAKQTTNERIIQNALILYAAGKYDRAAHEPPKNTNRRAVEISPRRANCARSERRANDEGNYTKSKFCII